MNGHTAAMSDIDFLGADGGKMAASFAAGCVATWGFLQGFFWRGLSKSYERRIKELEADNARCEQRQGQLEALLFFHGNDGLRDQMQAVLSEQRIEMLREFKRIWDAKEDKA